MVKQTAAAGKDHGQLPIGPDDGLARGALWATTAEDQVGHSGLKYGELTIDQISELDLSYSPPFASPWDALQTGAQALANELGRRAGPTTATRYRPGR